MAATSAARQVLAQTVTHSQRTSAGAPVAGSIRWWARWAVGSLPATSRSLRSSRARPPGRVTVPPPGSATHDLPRVARSPPAETKPSPSSSASASSTARPLTTPFRSRRSPRAVGRGGPSARISRQRPGRHRQRAPEPVRISENVRSYPAASSAGGDRRGRRGRRWRRRLWSASSSAVARTGETIDGFGLRAVEPLEVGVRPEPAERRLEGQRRGVSTAAVSGAVAPPTTTLAAHGAKAGGAHEVWVDACGALDGCDGCDRAGLEERAALPSLLRDSRPRRRGLPATAAVRARAAGVGSADDDGEDAESRHGRARRHDLEKPGATAGEDEAGGGGGHGSMKARVSESAL